MVSTHRRVTAAPAPGGSTRTAQSRHTCSISASISSWRPALRVAALHSAGDGARRFDSKASQRPTFSANTTGPSRTSNGLTAAMFATSARLVSKLGGGASKSSHTLARGPGRTAITTKPAAGRRDAPAPTACVAAASTARMYSAIASTLPTRASSSALDCSSTTLCLLNGSAACVNAAAVHSSTHAHHARHNDNAVLTGLPFAQGAAGCALGRGPARSSRQQLHLEHQRRIGRDHAARAACAVAELRRDQQHARAADLHALHAFVPAGDHHAAAKIEAERIVAILAGVELAAARVGRLGVVQPAGVVHGHLAAG